MPARVIILGLIQLFIVTIVGSMGNDQTRIVITSHGNTAFHSNPPFHDECIPHVTVTKSELIQLQYGGNTVAYMEL